MYLVTSYIGRSLLEMDFLLQEFDGKFSTPISKKSVVFAELMSDLPRFINESVVQDSLLDEYVFLIDSFYPSYGDILKCPKMIVVAYTINPVTTSSLVIHFSIVEYIWCYNDVSSNQKKKKFLMNSTPEHVVAIFLY
jgi:hypothetical protein